MKPFRVTVIIAVYNVENIIQQMLESVIRQSYPIYEIILIDNHSTDNSVATAKRFIKSHKQYPIRLICRKKTHGISDSYNLGAKLATGDYIVTLHSDSILSGKDELKKLLKPFTTSTSVVASIPLVVHRKQEWLQYNFWQKCLFAQVVETKHHSLNGKFDAYRRLIYVKTGGYDAKHFNHSVGSEDADMHFRIIKFGRVVRSDAQVIHVHVNDPSYGLGKWVSRRKFLAQAYAMQIKLHWAEMGWQILFFFIKPALAVITLMGFIRPVMFVPIALFVFWYMRRMFTDQATRFDKNILILPFVVIYLVYAETYWMLKSLFIKHHRV